MILFAPSSPLSLSHRFLCDAEFAYANVATVQLPWVEFGSERTNIFCKTNDPIAKISKNEGGLYYEVCPGYGY